MSGGPPVWRVLSPVPPGAFDGIGDFAGALTTALQAFGPTELFVRKDSWRELEHAAIEDTAGAVVQYFPQAFMRGDLRVLLGWLDQLRAARKPVVLTVHEYWPPLNGTVRRAVARLLFRRVLRACIRRSTAVVTSQEWSAHELASLARGHRIQAIPVGSSIPCAGSCAPAPPDGCRLVLFGQPAAMHAPTIAAVGAWLSSTPSGVSLTWLGRSTEELRNAGERLGLPAARVAYLGGLSAVEVSGALQSARIGLAPYENGASTRRTTFAALLEHRLPVVALDGVLTSEWLRESHACVWTPEGAPAQFVDAVSQLVTDVPRQAVLAARAREVFDTRLSWPRLAEAYARLLKEGAPA